MDSDAVTLITNDHRVLEGLFEQLRAGKGDRRALVGEVAARLTAHSRAEEERVYPAVREADPAEEAEVDHAYTEHAQAEQLLRKVGNLIDSPHFDQALEEFVAAVAHHVEEEESEVLPALRKAVDRVTLERLGEEFRTARTEHLRAAGFDEPDAGEPSADEPIAGEPIAGEPAADDLADATRDELYEMARQADIPGRSTMNKAELAAALEEQHG